MNVLPQHPFRLLIAGRSRSGKTTLLINLLNKVIVPQVDFVIVISPSLFSDPKWRIVANNLSLFYNDFNDKLGLELQDIIVRNSKDGLKTLIVFDDITRAVRNAKAGEATINRLIANCIWCNCSIIFSVQNVVHTTIEMRQNVDIVYMFQCLNKKELQRLYEEFGIGSFNFFRDLLSFATRQPYRFLHINRMGPSVQVFSSFNKINFSKTY